MNAVLLILLNSKLQPSTLGASNLSRRKGHVHIHKAPGSEIPGERVCEMSAWGRQEMLQMPHLWPLGWEV